MTPETFLQLTDLLPEPTLLLRADGTILAVNRACEQRLSLHSKGIQNRLVAHLVTDVADNVARYLRACSRSRAMVLGSLTLAIEPGQTVACRAEGAVLRPRTQELDALILLRLLPKASAAGQFVALNQRIEELGKEIHRRKQAEETIRRQEEWLRVTLESIGDAVIVTDAKGRVTSLNPVARSLTGWSAQEANGQPLTDVFHILHEPTREPVESPVDKVFEKRVAVGLGNHTILIARDGAEHPIEDSAAPIKDETGNILGVALVFRDVTEKRQADKDLQTSETQHRLLAEVSSALVGPLHYQSILRQVANVVVPTLGDYCFIDVLTTEDSIERVAWKHVDPSKADLGEKKRAFAPLKNDANNPVIRALTTGKPEFVPVIEEEWLRAAAVSSEHFEFLGELKPRSLMTVPMLVGERRHGTLTFCFNGSNRRHTSADLRIAQEIARRTALTVENVKLFNQLREADRRKDEFLAVLAHELRNPLAPLANALQILRLTSINEQAAQVRDMMERQVKHMVRLVDDLLDVSRITRGKIDLRKERLDLSDVVISALEISRPLIEAAKHELTITPSARLIYVDGDKTRLAQVLSNLLTNSAKYTPEGGRIWLTMEREGNDAIVSVRDNGMGIPAEMLPEIFEMFTQVDRTIGISQGGLGIGLTLARSLVELHGGSIKVRSDGPGKGSKFIVRLPVAVTELAQMVAPGQQAPASATAATPARRRMLVVDDNVDSAESLATMLRLLGNDVRTSHDGPTALELAAAFAPELVLLDIGLPGMDGYEVARRLRQMPSMEKAVLVAQTGWGQEEDRRRSGHAGFDHHFTKPIDPDALQMVLATLKAQEK